MYTHGAKAHIHGPQGQDLDIHGEQIVKVKQFLELHPQYCVLSIIEMFVLVSCTNLEPHLVLVPLIQSFHFCRQFVDPIRMH